MDVICSFFLQMIRVKPDEEDYWNSSNLKVKAFTFEDDDDDYTKVNSSEIILCQCHGTLSY